MCYNALNERCITMKITESVENYLETIFTLSKSGPVRSIDVANALNYSKPSVSRAVSNLKTAGYITMHSDGELTLTELGLQRANFIAHRHEMITEFLAKVLSIDPETAEKDACRIEHIISEETAVKMEEYLNSVVSE